MTRMRKRTKSHKPVALPFVALILAGCAVVSPGPQCSEDRIYRQARAGLSFPAACAADRASLTPAYEHGRRYWELDYQMWLLRQRNRDDLFIGQRVRYRAEYDALRRERALYNRWPPRGSE